MMGPKSRHHIISGLPYLCYRQSVNDFCDIRESRPLPLTQLQAKLPHGQASDRLEHMYQSIGCNRCAALFRPYHSLLSDGRNSAVPSAKSAYEQPSEGPQKAWIGYGFVPVLRDPERTFPLLTNPHTVLYRPLPDRLVRLAEPMVRRHQVRAYMGSNMRGSMGAPAGLASSGLAPKPLDQLPRLARDTTEEDPWPVSVLSQKYHDAVARWPGAWVEGQIVEINTRRTGSAYLTLRDNFEDISINVMGFRAFATQAREFRQGDRVVVHGRPDLWIKQTRLSFMADRIKRVGTGDLKEQIDQLRRKLKGEGLFDAENKIPLPEFPRRIGLICAPKARAEGDVITNARLRWPTIEFSVVHAHVQGPQCPPEVVEAIRKLDADPAVDVIIVARGGGSFEDLLGFSDESVVRATAACVTPIVSAIGHEDDWTLIDLAADLRASTPTDAAKRVVPDLVEQEGIIQEARMRINARIENMVEGEIRLIEGYANRPSLTKPQTMLDKPQRLVDESLVRLDIALRRIVDDASLTVEKLQSSLTALSPQSTLDRGYAVVQTLDGKVVVSPQQVQADQDLTLTVKEGRIETRVVSGQ